MGSYEDTEDYLTGRGAVIVGEKSATDKMCSGDAELNNFTFESALRTGLAFVVCYDLFKFTVRGANKFSECQLFSQFSIHRIRDLLSSCFAYASMSGTCEIAQSRTALRTRNLALVAPRSASSIPNSSTR